MGKRKAESQDAGHKAKGGLKKRVKKVLSEDEIQQSFRKGLFAQEVLQKYTKDYATSEPYKHSVIRDLINDGLLRSVRDEIRENVSFTPKETDIYRIHQSGDLANLDGLDDGALERLPSLLRLRDAMYSASFREYVATITGSGALSGRKTDMAINVYTPGCHLLCHDDVIGSRRVSYILYLVDPDIPWKGEWGGALRLFPTSLLGDDSNEEEEPTLVPNPDVSKVISPAWNQLSFFAVQPGESFHDVEEVYHAATEEQLKKEGGRIRMAISGWYHIPQIGEDGYVKGAEEKWGARSSLKQLEGNPDKWDFPKELPVAIEAPAHSTETADPSEKGLEVADLDFLLKYMAPNYLTPDMLEQVSERFMEESTVTLSGLLSNKFATRLREYVESQEATPLPESSAEIEKGSWRVARPPHKHRFMYLQTANKTKKEATELNPIEEILEVLLPSPQFRKWLEIATQCQIENYDILARRFRRGLDYSLATSHDGPSRLELGLGLTPTTGWGSDEVDESEEGESGSEGEDPKPKSKKDTKKAEEVKVEKEEVDVGGHEAYLAPDDDAADAAIYQNDPDGDDNILFTVPACWNTMNLVLRDSGVLKFVKYVSKSAQGDRWDISGAFDVKIEESEAGEEEGVSEGVILDSSSEATFNGFSDSDDSDSD